MLFKGKIHISFMLAIYCCIFSYCSFKIVISLCVAVYFLIIGDKYSLKYKQTIIVVIPGNFVLIFSRRKKLYGTVILVYYFRIVAPSYKYHACNLIENIFCNGADQNIKKPFGAVFIKMAKFVLYLEISMCHQETFT